MSIRNTRTLVNHSPGDSPLVRLRQQAVRNQSVVFKNYLNFFEQLGNTIDYKLSGPPMESAYWDFMKKRYFHQRQCYANSFKLTKNYSEFKFYFGFYDVYHVNYNESLYMKTVQHSFNIAKTNDGSNQERIFDSTLYLKNQLEPSHLFHLGKNYFGVHIPRNILIEMLMRDELGVSFKDISNYLKKEIFPSTKKTSILIQKLLKHQ